MVKLTEELIWLGLTTSVARKSDRIDELLRPVLVGLVREQRLPLARWALRTLPRLPASVTRAETFERLAMAAQASVPMAKPILTRVSARAFAEWLPKIVAPNSAPVDVGIRRSRNRLILTAGSEAGDYVIQIPSAEPLAIAVSEREAQDMNPRIVTLRRARPTSVRVGGGTVWIRDALGAIFEVPPLQPSVHGRDEVWRFNDAPSDVDSFRLGAVHYEHGVSVAVYASNATQVYLCVYDGANEIARIPFPNKNDGVWSGYIPDVANEFDYGFRADGPFEPARGQRYNPNKLLLDPYAKRITGNLEWNAAVYGFNVDDSIRDMGFNAADSAPYVPKARSLRARETPSLKSPAVQTDRMVMYQAHIKGLTSQHPGVPTHLQGRYAGMHSDAIIGHLRQLGVTSILLHPIHEFIDSSFLVERGLRDYYGGNPIGYFAPTSRFASHDSVAEFREMIGKLHDAGFEVIIMVDYDHTGEGDEQGPTLSWRGLDNLEYYSVSRSEPRRYENLTGTGNSLDFEKNAPRRMLLDSLRYWVQEMGVDGFFFRLATVLGRTADGFDPGAGSVLQEIRRDRDLSRVKLIAEPWDIGPGGYQLGNFPAGWSELNDKYKNTLRRFWRGERGLIGDLATRMCGSSDIFNRSGRSPQSSVNFISDHNGFTLADLYSYNQKHNEANREDNRDGPLADDSDNCGVEGPTDDRVIRSLRRRLRRNQLACLLLAHGIPILFGGDEVSNSQNGNNYAYCQDNKTGWIGWDHLQGEEDLTMFVSQLVELRTEFQQLRPKRWNSGKSNTPDAIDWFTSDAMPMTERDWKDPEATFLAYVLRGGDEEALYVAMNGSSEDRKAIAPRLQGVTGWQRHIDTAAELKENRRSRTSIVDGDESFMISARSLQVFRGIPPSSRV